METNDSIALVPAAVFLLLALFFPVTSGALLAYFVLALTAYKAAKYILERGKKQGI